jgi:hypothetical protein
LGFYIPVARPGFLFFVHFVSQCRILIKFTYLILKDMKFHYIIVVSTSFILLSIPVIAQNSRMTPARLMQMHHEEKRDNYVPNAYNNQRTSPGYRQTTAANKVSTASTVFTTQVNVNSSGDNILFDAANEPSIAINPLNSDEIVIGWRQFDNVQSNFRQAGWAYTTDGGNSWTFPGVIEPGIFRSDPVLDYDTLGNIYYNSLTNSPDFFCKVFKSDNGGASWDTGVDAQGGDKQWMTVDRTPGIGGGNIYSSWSSSFTTCPPGFFTRSTDDGASFEPCEIVDGDPYWVNMAVGLNGELFISGGGMGDSLVVAKSTTAQVPGGVVTWDPYAPVYLDGWLAGWTINWEGLLGQTNIDVDRSNGPGQGNVYVMASVTRISNNDPGDVMIARSTDGGTLWDPPVRINDDISSTNTQWFGTMSVAPNGRIDAVWLDTREDIAGLDSSALYYSYSVDQGNTWSVNEKISPLFDPHTGYPNQQKMGDYFDMISDNTGAHLAWASTLNGEQDVYYSFIVPPVSTGVQQVQVSNVFTVYPNPSAGGIFTISGIGTGDKFELFNSIGEKTRTFQVNKENTILDLSGLANGMYILKKTGSGGNFSMQKIVKN